MFLYALAMITVVVQALVLAASDLVVENRKYYIILPDSTKVFITPFHEGGGQNLVVFSPDSTHLVYTRSSGLGFESEGRGVYICKPDGTGRIFIFRQEFHIGKLSWKQIHGKDILVFNNGSGGMDVGKNFRVYDLENRRFIFMTAGDIEQAQGLCYQLSSEEYGRPRKSRIICLDTIIVPDMLDVQDGITYVKGNQVFNRLKRTDSLLLSSDELLSALGDSLTNPSSIEITEALLSPNRKMLYVAANIGQSLLGIYNRAKGQLIYRENPAFTTQRDIVWSGDSFKLAFVLEHGDGNDFRNPDSNTVVVFNSNNNGRFAKTYSSHYSIIDLHWSTNSDTLLYEFKADWSTMSERESIFVGDN